MGEKKEGKRVDESGKEGWKGGGEEARILKLKL